MARDLMDDSYYTSATKGGKIPVKWTAPEVYICDDVILQSAACRKLRMIPYIMHDIVYVVNFYHAQQNLLSALESCISSLAF